MDLIEFNCPSCKTNLSVPPAAASATGPCPTCGKTITGPGLPSKENPSPQPTAKAQEESSAPMLPGAPSVPHTTDGSGKIGLAPIAFIALLAVATAFFLGFLAGQKYEESQASTLKPKKTVAQAPKEEKQLITEESAEELIKQLPPKQPEESVEETPPSEETTAAKTTLIAFLSAPDWTSRLVYVLHPDQVASKMESVAKEQGDGPIPYQEIMTVGLGKADAEVFGITTEKYPGGIPIAVKKVENQWLIDWAAFAEFYYDGFRLFAESATGYEGIFRVQVAPVNDKPGHYTLSPPTAGKIYEARVNPESSANEQIESVMNFYRDNSSEQFEAAVAQGGINLMLKVSRQDIDGEQIIFIEDVVAVGWAPREPEE